MHHVFKAKVPDNAEPTANQEIVGSKLVSWEEILQLNTSRGIKILHSHIERDTRFSGFQTSLPSAISSNSFSILAVKE